MTKEIRLATASFLDSSQAQALAASDQTSEVAAAFFDACYGDLGKAPRLLEEQDLDRLLLELIPARLRKRKRDPKQTLEIVRALFAHLETTQIVPQAWELQRALETLADAFVSAVGVGNLAGTRSKKQQTVSHQAAKIGRNDPCWCGSGKKFKKCCGAKK